MTVASSGGGGETAKDVSAWTPDLIRSLLAETDRRYEQRFEAQEKAVMSALAAAKEAVSAALAAAEKATNKAEADVEKWRQANNEWRAAMLDREVKFVQRPEFDSEIRGLETKHDEANKSMAQRLASLERSRDMSVGRTAAAGAALVIVFSVIALAIRFL